MKPTSIIFLAMSLVLLFGGFLTCKVAESIADKQNVRIYDQEIDDNGDAVYTYNLSSEDVTRLNLTFSGAEVRFHGTEKESYIELKNFAVNSYSTKLSGNTVSIDGTVGKLSSLVDFSGGGVKFKGLRYFLVGKPDSSRKKTVDVYISKKSHIKNITLASEKGNVTLDKLTGDFDYFISVNKADVTVKSVETQSVGEINVTDGNINIEKSLIKSLSANSTGGNITLKNGGKYSPDVISYSLKSEEGSVVYNEEDMGGSYKVVSADPKSSVNLETSTGTIYVYDK